MTDNGIYEDLFGDKTAVLRAFCVPEEEWPNIDIWYARYVNECYEGHAFVLFQDKREPDILFTVNAGHCSCYGLENGWSPIAVNNMAVLEHVLGVEMHSDITMSIEIKKKLQARAKNVLDT